MYTTDSEIYNVAQRMQDSGANIYQDDPDWYEYRVDLLYQGRVIDTYDSLAESYNGIQRLDRARCESAVAEIEADVAAGRASEWFLLAS